MGVNFQSRLVTRKEQREFEEEMRRDMSRALCIHRFKRKSVK